MDRTWRNWGPAADFLMIGGLLWIIVASAYSPLTPANSSGPFMLLLGVTDPVFGGDTIGGVILAFATIGLIYWSLYETGRGGGLYYWVNGHMIKEAQPFSKGRGYGAWQGFYYAAFWCTFWALLYNLVFAVYAASPGTFPGNSLTAWVYAFNHYNAFVAKLGYVGAGAYLPALLTWVARAYPKQALHRLGLLRIKHWYSETADEAELSEALSRLAEQQNAAFIWTQMWR